MRNQTSNQRTIYYSNYLGKGDVFDENGYRTGEEEDKWEDPKKIRLNVSNVKGEEDFAAFGGYLDYDRTLFTTNKKCPIREGTLIWFGKDPSKNPYNYIVKRVSDSKNALRIAIKEVQVSESK